MRHVSAIIRKQLRDTLKNKTILIQFVMFPILTIVMNRAMTMDGMPKNFFSYLFGTMYIGMAPLTSVAAIISEEKEHGVLQLLQLMNVKAAEYLIGIGSYVFVICLFFSIIFPMTGDYTGHEILIFMSVMAIGLIISVMVGAIIGCLVKNQMAATSITIPVMMILSFLPMLSIFNDKIGAVSKFLYTGQIQNILSGELIVISENIVILSMNCLLIFLGFVAAFRKSFQR